MPGSIQKIAAERHELALALRDIRERLDGIAQTNRLLVRAYAAKHPLGVDLSDRSDEYVAGFLAGQVNALDELTADPDMAPYA